jgi:hypothetical protein
MLLALLNKEGLENISEFAREFKLVDPLRGADEVISYSTKFFNLLQTSEFPHRYSPSNKPCSSS